MLRLFVLAFIVIVLAAGSVSAQFYGNPYGMNPYYSRAPQPRVQAPQPRAQTPEALVHQGIAKLRRFLSQGKGRDSNALGGFVASEIAPYFDFDYMTKWALGPAWRAMPANARTQAATRLQGHFLKSLVQKVGDARFTRVKVGRSYRGNSRNELIVPLTVYRHRGQATRLNFRFYRAKSGWKVFDISANGQSAVVFYRGYFRRMMQQTR